MMILFERGEGSVQKTMVFIGNYCRQLDGDRGHATGGERFAGTKSTFLLKVCVSLRRDDTGAAPRRWGRHRVDCCSTRDRPWGSKTRRFA